LKAIHGNSLKRERKEFVYYYENRYGHDWLKRIISPVTDHVEGIYHEIIIESVFQNQELVGYKFSGKLETHYIPFSKEKVDEIIENPMESDKDSIKFLFTDGQLGYEFPYEEFVNRSYEELVSMLIAPCGPKTILQKKQLEAWHKQQQQLTEALARATVTNNNNNKQQKQQ
jgi:hypothetical protein